LEIVRGSGKGLVRESGSISNVLEELVQESEVVVLGKIAQTGTVWDSIKATDPMYKNTRIPKSFELTVGNQKIWVAPNASKHLWEYMTKYKEMSHGMPINSQSLLSSFKASVEKAIKLGILYTEKPIIIDSWEFMFSPPRHKGLLPVIKHAMYKPKGF
jgi:hypothetical protein